MSWTCHNSQTLRLLPVCIMGLIPSTISPGEHNISSALEGTTYTSASGRQNAPLLDKTVDQINEKKISPQLQCGWSSLCGGRIDQVQSGENKNAFSHYGEISSVMKLKGFQEKSCQSKSLILPPRLPRWSVGVSDCSYPRYSLEHFRESAYSRWPIPPRRDWAQTLSRPPSKLTGRALSIATWCSIPIVGRGKDIENASVECQHLD
jgi:hypothetical protein